MNKDNCYKEEEFYIINEIAKGMFDKFVELLKKNIDHLTPNVLETVSELIIIDIIRLISKEGKFHAAVDNMAQNIKKFSDNFNAREMIDKCIMSNHHH